MAGIDFVFMISRSTLVIKIVLVVLLLMSVSSWSIIFFKFFQLTRENKRIAKDLFFFRGAKDLRAAALRVERKPDSPSYLLAREGLNEYKRLKGMEQYPGEKTNVILDNIRYTLKEEMDVQTEKLFGSISFLATCVTTAPLLGLFGTVWGIMNSFHSFKGLTTASLSAVAPGLAEALVTTALGLVVAIPASLAHNILLRVLGQVENKLIKLSGTFLHQVEREVLGDTSRVHPPSQKNQHNL
ncbi:MotA/TolQ/ExbB proton channel family protein [Thermodesulfobacteriota bacterium]